MSNKATVLIADDHSVVVEGIRRAIEKETDFELVGVASDGLEAIEKVKTLKPDLIILDVSMPNLNGVETAHQIRKWSDRTRVVIFSMYSDKEYVTELFGSGVSAYVLKEEPLSDLLLALRAVRAGGTYYSKAIQERLKDHMRELELGERGKGLEEVKDGLAKLSVREKEVFVLLADGYTPKEIADRLCISPKTAETHKYNIMEKLKARSLAALTKMAIKKDLIDL
ncbi:MAG: response regulator transcription factor [Deltaproteobacteria bacterium]|nr:response regulator transcription factor [Deltaproteobacteria bacterium]